MPRGLCPRRQGDGRFINSEDQRTSPVTPRALRMKYVEQNKRERSFLSPKAMR